MSRSQGSAREEGRGSSALVGFGWIFLGVVLGVGLSRAISPGVDATEKAPLVTSESTSARAALLAQLETERAEKVSLQKEIRETRAQLVESNRARIKREEEFLNYTKMITSLVPPEAPPEIVQALTGEVPESSLPKEDEALILERASRKARADEIARLMRSYMRVDQFDSLDLLELGTLGDGWVGPVVFRIIDERGRPAGSISADRLRLEGSRAGWTLTFVFEAGYERRHGERVPFENTMPGEERGGERRILLSHTDPGPWFEVMPELFGEARPEAIADDGLWHAVLVHRRLNELLAYDAADGSYRLSRLGGVVDGVLRNVEVEQLTSEGHIVQRLAADRLEIAEDERGVQLTLRDGVLMKGAKQHAFLDGRYRIYLPRAKHEDWRAAGLPGLVEAEDSTAGSGSPLSVR